MKRHTKERGEKEKGDEKRETKERGEKEKGEEGILGKETLGRATGWHRIGSTVL